MGTLFVVATPIGNLGDLSGRARTTLIDCPLVVAEDTRRTGKLTSMIGSPARLISLNEHNLSRRIEPILAELAAGDVALVSDAGTPAISDPGFQLIDAALTAGFTVRTVPGPSAVTAALSVSGLPATPFYFGGFAPRTQGELRRWFGDWLDREITIVFFESPNRIDKTMAILHDVRPDTTVVVCRELSKLHEQIVRGSPALVSEMIARNEIPTRGEFVLVMRASGKRPTIDPEVLLRQLIADGTSPNEAAKRAAAETGRPKSEFYAQAVTLSKTRSQGD